MELVRALDLEQWSETVTSRTVLPKWVASLIRATADISAIRFPSGDMGEMRGFDGRLESSGFQPFVPAGKSVWEFGTSSDPRRKANEDYRDRTQDPRDVEARSTTFVFVTSRPWEKAPEWASERRAENKWADVRVIDAVDLESWFAIAPAVALDFAQEIGLIPPTGVSSLQQFWDEFAARTAPRLTHHVLIAGRSEEARKIVDHVKGAPDIFVLQGDSKDEALAFVAASIKSASAEVQDYAFARAIVVRDDEVARRLPNRASLVVGLRGPSETAGFLATSRHRVVVPLGNDAGHQRQTRFRLKKASRTDFAAALQQMQIPEEEAQRLARECGRSVTVLQRRKASAAFEPSLWATHAEMRRGLVPAVWAGAWDRTSEPDRTVLTLLAAATEYDSFEAGIIELSRMSDPPVELIGNMWTVTAPVDAFEQLAPYVSTQNLKHLQEAVRAVYSEIDPGIDLSSEEQFLAPLRGQTLSHSEWLRDGLAEALLMIAVLGEPRLTILQNPQPFVDDMIRSLDGLQKNHRLIASLANQLPVLMEAAPRPLLEALEHLLEGDELKSIFREEGVLGPSSPHVSLLWALEGLAWDPSYFERVAVILARLAALDPGGQISNRPLNSLRDIFLPWHPGTNAGAKERLRVLDLLLNKHPAVGWDLLGKIVPQSLDSTTGTHQPLWRDAGASEREPLTRRGVHEHHRLLIDRLLTHVGMVPERWKTVMETFGNFPEEDRDRVYAMLENLPLDVDPVLREGLWSRVRDIAARHTNLAAAEFGIWKSEVDRLHAIEERLRPADAVKRLGWLFDDHFPTLPTKWHEESWERIAEMRAVAVADVLKELGLEGLIELSRQVQYPGLVASAVASVISLPAALALVDSASSSPDPNARFMAAALSGAVERNHPTELRGWATERVRQWEHSRLVDCLIRWDDDSDTWRFVGTLGPEIEALYWRTKPVWPIKDADDLLFAARRYLEIGRALEAVDGLPDLEQHADSQLLLDLLDAVVGELNAGKSPRFQLLKYHIEQIIGRLAERTDVSEMDVAQREYAYIALLDRRPKPLTIHRLLAKDPAFFAQLIKDSFKPASQVGVEVTERQRDRAGTAFRLLRSWKTVPGLSESAADPQHLNHWMDEARRLAAADDRAVIADQQIGQLLAHAPNDPEDGAWPHRHVRDLIERVSSADIERGIELGVFNKRGVWSKSLYEGGLQERELANQARANASAANDWPRTRRMLLRIAESWERQATREDEEVEQRKSREG